MEIEKNDNKKYNNHNNHDNIEEVKKSSNSLASLTSLAQIKMIGIDYNRANIEQRGVFALSHSKYAEVANKLKENQNIDGVVIISTCNRTEFWFSCVDENCTLLDILCSAMNVNPTDYMDLFVSRNGVVAVEYLFELVCGIHSQIFGEDQILTQTKSAIERARAIKSDDTVLSVLFRTAITAGKKVKTSVVLSENNSSVAKQAIDSIETKLSSLENKKCLVIGNGQTGRLVAKILVEKKANTYMTLRQYKRHDTVIPYGTSVIPYDDRFKHIPDMDIIFSATLSPNFTVTYDDINGTLDENKNYLFVDLAVPRDIKTNINDIPNVTLYDVDTFSQSNEHADTEQLRLAKNIIDDYVKEFERWFYFREHIHSVKEISDISATQAKGKLRKTIKHLDISDEEKTKLSNEVASSTQKIVSSLMYGLREHLDSDVWLECMSALEKSANDM